MANTVDIWAYESADVAIRAWRNLTETEREEADIIWRYSMQRSMDQAIARTDDMRNDIHEHTKRLASLERWRVTVTAILMALGVAGGGSLTAFAIIDRIAK